MKPGQFHWTDGWYFSRNDDGSVHIEKSADGTVGSPIVLEATIPPAEWASIVSHVSAGGEPASYAAAERLHSGTP